jgi:hypothetical protein
MTIMHISSLTLDPRFASCWSNPFSSKAVVAARQIAPALVNQGPPRSKAVHINSNMSILVRRFLVYSVAR